jgi:bacteriocin biosynthesis cyclodehydratase domain-containing protein
MHGTPIRIGAHGSFGQDVAERLVELCGRAECAVRTIPGMPDDGLSSFLGGGGLGILSTCRDLTSDMDAFAAAAAAAQLSWLPVALDSGRVRIGPVLAPGAAPCYVCYSRRLAQHRPAVETANMDREHAFRQDDAHGVMGHPPHIAAIAAGLALTLARSSASDRPGRRLYFIDLISEAVSAYQVIPVHGCPACDSAADSNAADSERTGRLRALAAELVPALDDLWLEGRLWHTREWCPE